MPLQQPFSYSCPNDTYPLAALLYHTYTYLPDAHLTPSAHRHPSRPALPALLLTLWRRLPRLPLPPWVVVWRAFASLLPPRACRYRCVTANTAFGIPRPAITTRYHLFYPRLPHRCGTTGLHGHCDAARIHARLLPAGASAGLLRWTDYRFSPFSGPLQALPATAVSCPFVSCCLPRSLADIPTSLPPSLCRTARHYPSPPVAHPYARMPRLLRTSLAPAAACRLPTLLPMPNLNLAPLVCSPVYRARDAPGCAATGRVRRAVCGWFVSIRPFTRGTCHS